MLDSVNLLVDRMLRLTSTSTLPLSSVSGTRLYWQQLCALHRHFHLPLTTCIPHSHSHGWSWLSAVTCLFAALPCHPALLHAVSHRRTLCLLHCPAFLPCRMLCPATLPSL